MEDKSKRTNHQQPPPQPSFSAPEMEAALQLIQLSGDSDADLNSHELNDSASDLLTSTASKKKRKEVVGDYGESHGSSTCTSDLSSVNRFVNRWCIDEEEDENCVAGSRRKRKKFRSVVEIYEISNYC